MIGYTNAEVAREEKYREESQKIQRAVPRIKVGELDYMQNIQKDNDQVNSPSHYTSGGIETIDFIEAKRLNYNLGNAVKYITRAGVKFRVDKNATEARIEDLEKAIWYLQREIKTLKGK